ncbi:MAG: hypothetical protein K5765_04650 [Clostridia bacterium]|nr:hypothetical protein [Clostridia bacterium]
MPNTDQNQAYQQYEPTCGVILVLGLLEAGKTTFIQNTFIKHYKSQKDNGKTCLLVFEEGEEEYDDAAIKNLGIDVYHLEQSDCNFTKLSLIEQTGKYDRAIVELNGMWNMDTFWDALPNEWGVERVITILNSETIIAENANMRQLVFDKVSTSDLVAFNRVKKDADKMPLHKLIRQITRNCEIVYQLTDNTVVEDDIVDPLPYDINADIINIENRDFAYFYRDMVENMNNYNNKKVKFLGLIGWDASLGNNTAIIGRHIMTCCEADTKYSGFVLTHDGKMKFKTGTWAIVTAKIEIKKHYAYDGVGPVFVAEKIELTPPLPKEEMVTYFY